MQPRVFAIAVVAAVLGGAAALAIGALTGATGGQTSTVVVERTIPVDVAAPAAVPPIGTGFNPAAIYARRSPGVVTIYADLGVEGQAQGSGFIVDRDGTILTNAHVVTDVAHSSGGAVTGAETVYVEFKDGDRVPAKIVGWDLFSDVAAIRVDTALHPVAPVPLGRSATVVVGTPVAAIGSPFNEQSSLSVGVVSATNRTIDSLTSGYSISDAIQTDAPINHGNSGGPLFDARGRVIGINAQIRSTSGAGEGVGFAIPIDTARRALDQLVRTGRVSYAYVGVTTQDVTPRLAQKFGFTASRGALVAKVQPDTPASRAGLRGGTSVEDADGVQVSLGGDVIVRIGGTQITSAQDVSRAVALHVAGEKVQFAVLRGGKTRRVVQVTLAERPS
ncbi:MAG: trypsin-like peptidase domain-containing protein [Thermoleophilia bacterium]|nr:trypsin-like peptidase domain-containing protein [Thermoleophilia bacterium]